ncbi:unnamed protein product, partial [Brenthis ino]
MIKQIILLLALISSVHLSVIPLDGLVLFRRADWRPTTQHLLKVVFSQIAFFIGIDMFKQVILLFVLISSVHLLQLNNPWLHRRLSDDQSCVPNTVIKVSCNICHCSPDGRIVGCKPVLCNDDVYFPSRG